MASSSTQSFDEAKDRFNSAVADAVTEACAAAARVAAETSSSTKSSAELGNAKKASDPFPQDMYATPTDPSPIPTVKRIEPKNLAEDIESGNIESGSTNEAVQHKVEEKAQEEAAAGGDETPAAAIAVEGDDGAGTKEDQQTKDEDAKAVATREAKADSWYVSLGAPSTVVAHPPVPPLVPRPVPTQLRRCLTGGTGEAGGAGESEEEMPSNLPLTPAQGDKVSPCSTGTWTTLAPAPPRAGPAVAGSRPRAGGLATMDDAAAAVGAAAMALTAAVAAATTAAAKSGAEIRDADAPLTIRAGTFSPSESPTASPIGSSPTWAPTPDTGGQKPYGHRGVGAPFDRPRRSVYERKASDSTIVLTTSSRVSTSPASTVLAEKRGRGVLGRLQPASLVVLGKSDQPLNRRAPLPLSLPFTGASPPPPTTKATVVPGGVRANRRAGDKSPRAAGAVFSPPDRAVGAVTRQQTRQQPRSFGGTRSTSGGELPRGDRPQQPRLINAQTPAKREPKVEPPGPRRRAVVVQSTGAYNIDGPDLKALAATIQSMQESVRSLYKAKANEAGEAPGVAAPPVGVGAKVAADPFLKAPRRAAPPPRSARSGRPLFRAAGI